MNEEITADSIIDAIAVIELQRQEMHRESDPEAWRNRALAKLQAMLQQLEEAQRLHGPSPEQLANTQAVMTAIGTIKARAGATAKHPVRKGTETHRRDGSRRGATRQPAAGPGKRRHMGRRSG